MVEQNLPLCPCGSGKVYEECCYKKIGPDGEHLFDKGAIFYDGKAYHPIPNVRFAVRVGVQAIDEYREYAKELVKKSNLAEKHYNDFVNHYGLFFQSYKQLLKTLLTPGGKGVAFQTDSIESRKQWKDFLLHGRILLDYIGLHSRGTLGLNQKIGGLNNKKYSSLLNILKKLGEKDNSYLEIKSKLEQIQGDINLFIRFRDKEKSQDTIIDFPTIDDEFGLVEDGKIALNNNETYEMIKFIESSYNSIHKLVLILLRIS